MIGMCKHRAVQNAVDGECSFCLLFQNCSEAGWVSTETVEVEVGNMGPVVGQKLNF